MDTPRRVALIISTSTSYGRSILRGVGKYARSRGGWSFYVEAWWEVAPFPSLKTCDGVIGHFYFEKLNHAMLASGLPIVNISAIRPEPAVPQVVQDDKAIGRMVASYLLERGFESFAFCGFPSAEFSNDRQAGFVDEIPDGGQCQVYEPPTTRKAQTWERLSRSI